MSCLTPMDYMYQVLTSEITSVTVKQYVFGIFLHLLAEPEEVLIGSMDHSCYKKFEGNPNAELPLNIYPHLPVFVQFFRSSFIFGEKYLTLRKAYFFKYRQAHPLLKTCWKRRTQEHVHRTFSTLPDYPYAFED